MSFKHNNAGKAGGGQLTSTRDVGFVPFSGLVAAQVLAVSSVEELEPGVALVQRQCRVLEVGRSRVRSVVDRRRTAAHDRYTPQPPLTVMSHSVARLHGRLSWGENNLPNF